MVTTANFIATTDTPQLGDVIAELHPDPEARLADTDTFRLVASWLPATVTSSSDVIGVYDYGIALNSDGSHMVMDWSRVSSDNGSVIKVRLLLSYVPKHDVIFAMSVLTVSVVKILMMTIMHVRTV